eukprot:7449326-Lingulodinium_polyedra.AAC.1
MFARTTARCNEARKMTANETTRSFLAPQPKKRETTNWSPAFAQTLTRLTRRGCLPQTRRRAGS